MPHDSQNAPGPRLQLNWEEYQPRACVTLAVIIEDVLQEEEGEGPMLCRDRIVRTEYTFLAPREIFCTYGCATTAESVLRDFGSGSKRGDQVMATG